MNVVTFYIVILDSDICNGDNQSGGEYAERSLLRNKQTLKNLGIEQTVKRPIAPAGFCPP